MRSSPKVAQSFLDQAVQSAGERRFGEAGQQFLRALEAIEAWPDGPKRSSKLGLLASLCSRAGHPDLALMALQSLLESKDSRGSSRHSADLLTLANSWRELGRLNASSTVNAMALDHALRCQRYGDAAAASTNLAIIDASVGRLREALPRLLDSLAFLKKESNPDTDAITRLALIRIVDALEMDPKVALDASADLFTRLKPFVGPRRWKEAEPAFHRVVERYIESHPGIDGEKWKRDAFPLVFGDQST